MEIYTPRNNENRVSEFRPTPTSPPPPPSVPPPSPPRPPSPSPVATYNSKPTEEVNEDKQSRMPYLAALTTFILLFLSSLYSVLALVMYVVEKWLVKPQKDTAGDIFDFSSFESYGAVIAISTLIVAIPALVLLILKVRNSEAGESWRNSQKWRRIIYTVTAVILITSLVSTLVGTVFEVLSNTLKLSDLSLSYYDSSTPKIDTDGQLKAAIISGIISALIISAAIVAIAFEYANRQSKVIWGMLTGLAIIGAITGGISIGHINKAVSDAKKKQSSYSSPGDGYGTNNPSPTNDSYLTPSSNDPNLQTVRSDLEYYASSHEGKFPTKAEWDNGSLKPDYLLSSDEILKKITYTPSGCETNGCSAYTISAKDANGKVVEVSS